MLSPPTRDMLEILVVEAKYLADLVVDRISLRVWFMRNGHHGLAAENKKGAKRRIIIDLKKARLISFWPRSSPCIS